MTGWRDGEEEVTEAPGRDAQERAQDAGTLAAAQLPRPLLRGSGAFPAEVQAEDSGDPVMLRGL